MNRHPTNCPQNSLASDEVRYWIQSRLNFQRVQATRLEFATQQGIEQGNQQERLNVAVKLLSTGVPLEAISQATGLSQEELEALQASDT